MSRIISNFESNYSTKNNAFPYQVQAFTTLKDLNYSAIFHEQGLGKTKIAIDLLLYWLSERNIDTVMIVTKKQLVKNWMDEFAFHTYIKPQILSSNKNENFYVLNSPVKVIVTNFETISSDKERIILFLKCRNVGIIIDESTKLKNPTARITKDFFDLSMLFKIKTIMTGTPIANRPYDIWSQIYFLDRGKSLGVNFEQFKINTNLSNDLAENRKKRDRFQSSVASIYERISQFSVRETKKSCGIELPEKIYLTQQANFEKKQLQMYKKVMKELEIEVRKDNETVIDDDSISLKRLLRLMQIASNPRLVDDSYSEISGKEIILDNLIKEIICNGEKCIVWSSFIENIEFFANKYSKYNPRKIHGAMTLEDRNNSVDIFKNKKECSVLFATPQAAKEGLTLTVANHVIFYDRGFNLDDYLQAQDRIHRISQKRKCYIHNIMMLNSVDEWVDKLLQAKQYAAFLAQGDISIQEYIKCEDYSYGKIIREILML